MNIFYSLPEGIKDTLIILGDFDGVHLAHMSVIQKGMEYAKNHSLKSGIFMFENNTKNAKLITQNKEKLKIFEKLSPDFVYVQKFDDDLRKKTPEEFIQMLIEKLGMRAVCIGYDYRFGYMAQGDVDTMYNLGNKYGFQVIVAPKLTIDGDVISSTHIRKLIEEGKVEEAARFLGKYFAIRGTVEKGLQNGTKLGFPTANISTGNNVELPKNGVYAGFSVVCGKKYKSVINVGNNPTFEGKKITVESHIIDFSEDIYGKEATVYFVAHIRDDIKFESVENLVEQISKDKEKATEILLNIGE